MSSGKPEDVVMVGREETFVFGTLLFTSCANKRVPNTKGAKHESSSLPTIRITVSSGLPEDTVTSLNLF